MCDENSKCCETGEDMPCHGHIDLSKDHGPAHLRHVRRDVLDMTQEQFSVLMGVSIATLRNWERGQTPVPPYFETVLKIVEADPQAAMSALGVARCSDTPVETGWDKIQPGSPSEHARKMAVEKLKSDQLSSRMMDIADELKAFADDARVLGYDFDRKDVLGLAILAELERVRKAAYM